MSEPRDIRRRGTTATISMCLIVLLFLALTGSVAARPASASGRTATASEYTITGLDWGQGDLQPAFSRASARYKQRTKAKVNYGLDIEATDANGNPVSLSKVGCDLRVGLYYRGVCKQRATVSAYANLPSGYFNTLTFTCAAKPGSYTLKLQAVHLPSGFKTSTVSLKFKVLGRS